MLSAHLICKCKPCWSGLSAVTQFSQQHALFLQERLEIQIKVWIRVARSSKAEVRVHHRVQGLQGAQSCPWFGWQCTP